MLWSNWDYFIMMNDDGVRARFKNRHSHSVFYGRKNLKNYKSRSASLWGAKTSEKIEKTRFWRYKLMNNF